MIVHLTVKNLVLPLGWWVPLDYIHTIVFAFPNWDSAGNYSSIHSHRHASKSKYTGKAAPVAFCKNTKIKVSKVAQSDAPNSLVEVFLGLELLCLWQWMGDTQQCQTVKHHHGGIDMTSVAKEKEKNGLKTIQAQFIPGAILLIGWFSSYFLLDTLIYSATSWASYSDSSGCGTMSAHIWVELLFWGSTQRNNLKCRNSITFLFCLWATR